MTTISELEGKTLTAVNGLKKGSERIVFVCDDNTEYIMYHHQECCETVLVEDVCGDVESLVGCPIIRAITNTSNLKDEDMMSQTWTFYDLVTKKGAVTFRWLGESNGWYSEGVDFEKG